MNSQKKNSPSNHLYFQFFFSFGPFRFCWSMIWCSWRLVPINVDTVLLNLFYLLLWYFHFRTALIVGNYLQFIHAVGAHICINKIYSQVLWFALRMNKNSLAFLTLKLHLFSCVLWLQFCWGYQSASFFGFSIHEGNSSFISNLDAYPSWSWNYLIMETTTLVAISISASSSLCDLMDIIR